jgi:drug/metabolite transporter (DMT)-like permease
MTASTLGPARLSAPIMAACLMLVSALLAAVMNALIRYGTIEMHAFQVTFFRNFFGLVAILPWLVAQGLAVLKNRKGGRVAASAILNLFSMITYYVAVAQMPLAEVVALFFTKPLFATAGAALILGEKVGPRRWGATLCGFLGVLLVLQPGIREISPYSWMVLVSAALFAGVSLVVKDATSSASAPTIVFYMSITLTVLSFPPALLEWTALSWQGWGLGAAIGFVGTLSWLAFTRAFALADASAVMPFEFLKLPAMAVVAYLLFDEVPGPFLWLGGALIFASTIYIGHREAKLARVRPASLNPGTAPVVAGADPRKS